MRASRFVAGKSFQKVLIGIDNRTTLMLGHTRWRMRGDEKVSANNHPIRASFYRHVLLLVAIRGACETAWVNTIAVAGIKRRRIVSGRWPE